MWFNAIHKVSVECNGRCVRYVSEAMCDRLNHKTVLTQCISGRRFPALSLFPQIWGWSRSTLPYWTCPHPVFLVDSRERTPSERFHTGWKPHQGNSLFKGLGPPKQQQSLLGSPFLSPAELFWKPSVLKGPWLESSGGPRMGCPGFFFSFSL